MAAFTPGNVVVYRVGTGTGSLVNTGNAVFLDEYTAAGALVQSIALPTIGSGANHALIASGTATSEGMLTLSADGHYLVLTGYDRAPGGSGSISGTTSAAVPRDVGIVDAAGSINTSTTLTAFGTNNIRSATSSNGTDIWIVGGQDGVQYTTTGSNSSTTVSNTNANLRDVQIFNGQLYVSSGSGAVVHLGTVGIGEPTTAGQTTTSLPGFPTSGSQYGFFFADLTSAVAGVDTLYVADDTAGGGQVQKYSLVGGSWTLNGFIADAAVRGLTASVNGSSVTLFTTTGAGTATGGGSLDTFTDTGGYNTTINGTLTHLASAAANTAFRGVAFAPIAPDTTAPTLITSSPADSATAVAPNANIVLTFSEAVQAGAGIITITDGAGDTRSIAATDTTQVTFSGSTVTINPTADLAGSDTYHVTFGARVVTDTAGNSYAGLASSALDFTTADITPPTLTSAAPADNATNVAAISNIVLTFNEAVLAGSGSITITDGAGDVRTIAVTDPQVTINGDTVTINPTADLHAGASYDVIVPSGAFTDTSGNAFAGVAQDALDFTVAAGSTRIFSEDFANFTAAGFAPVPAAGQLDSDIWRVVGLSDTANPTYGFTGAAGGDFGRGIINGSADPATAGVYSPSANHALILQPTGAEIDVNGFIEAKIQNTSGATASSFDVAFDWAYRNSGDRGDNLELSYSTDGTNFTPVTATDFTTPTTKDATVAAMFADQHEQVSLTGLSVADQGFLYLRWTHLSSAGSSNRDEVGIDNVTVDAGTAPTNPTFSIAAADASKAEGSGGGTTPYTFTITQANPGAASSVDYAITGLGGAGQAIAGDFAGPISGTVNFAVGQAAQTITINVNADTTDEPNETFSVTLSNSSAGAGIGTATANGAILNDDATITRIYTIQGSGQTSTLVGQTITTQGIVTAVASNGFYIQDATGDGNAATSDGVFVFTSSAPSAAAAVGALVNVTGAVSEFTPAGSAAGTLSVTEISGSVSVTQLSPVNSLPAAVVIGGPGGLVPPAGDLAAGATFFEALEGMRVTVVAPQATGPTNQFGEIFTVADNGANATGVNSRGDILISGGTTSFGNTDTAGGDFNPERIQIDPGLGQPTPNVSVGAKLNDVTGILNYSFGNYEVLATTPVTVATASPLVKTGTSLTGDANHILIASYNAENLDPGDGAARFTTVANEIIAKLNAPDILTLQEVQDNDGPTDNGVTAANLTLSMIVNAINAAGGPQYAVIDNPFIGNDTNGGEPGGNIRTAYLYRTDHVSVVTGSLRTIGADGSAISAGPDTAQQTDPNNPFFASRPPLAVDFVFNGQIITIVNDHFTSKGGSGVLLGSVQPPFDAGEVQRAAQAQAVNTFVDNLLTANPNARVIVTGDLNDYGFEQPLSVLKGTASISNYTANGADPFNATATYTPGGTQILNDLQDTLPVDQRFDYVFEGNAQTLDHMLASNSLAAGAQFQPVHINSEFFDQTSDHDPLVGLFSIAAADATAPLLVSSTPADNAPTVAIAANIVLTFSEAVKAGSGNIILRPATGADISIPVGNAQVTFSGNTVTINPTADLRPGVAYDVIIGSGAITDLASNPFAGIAQDALDFVTSSTIPAGTFAQTFSITDPGTFMLLGGTTRTETANTAVSAMVATGSATIDIEGTLNDTGTKKTAISATLNGGGQILVGASGIVENFNADSIVNGAVNATVNLTNLGQIIARTTAFTPSLGGTNPGSGFALNYNAAKGAAGAPATDYTSGGVITNGAAGNTTALIESDNGDAIRLGSHTTLINYGTIKATGPVNDASTNNSFNGTSTAQTYDVSRGVRFNQNNGTAGKIENYGAIEGAQHAVDVGQTNITNLVINNYATGTIVGHNGSGVGADTIGAAANTVTVENFGMIRGEYAPTFDRAGLATLDGDGDGVDVDGGATIINHIGATIAGSGANGVLNGQGAGGFDSNGRANKSEGLSLGGGSVTNDGTISGANIGITVNNDSSPDNSRSGVLATAIINNETGTIVGQAGVAIRLENKTGMATVDNDTIINHGVIVGNGAIPDPAGVVLREDGLADPGTVGVLDGVIYTSANAGSARFISGDGSAIQTGEGSDTLTNFGVITGNSGRAINLEGGTDTLNLVTGETILGRIDGGAGLDTIHLQGAGSGTLSNVINFEALSVEGGVWTIADTEAYSGGVTIAAGTLLIDGELTGSPVAVNGGTLGGSGSGIVGAVTLASGAILSPGEGPGTLATGNLSLVAGAIVKVEVGGTDPGRFDQVNVVGSVILSGATLAASLVNGFDANAAAGNTFTIINNDLADAVIGTFSGLAEGARFSTSTSTFSISYVGGDGNDVVLTAIDTQAPATPTITAVFNYGDHFDVVGMAEAGSTVKITDSNSATVSFSTVADGSAQYDAASSSPLADGSHTITAVATDSAGNVSGPAIANIATQTVGGIHQIFSDSNVTITEDSAVTNVVLEGGGLAATGNSHGNTLYSVETSTSDVNTLIGGSGNDLLVGGIGADHLQGGAGNDAYALYNSGTQISDSGGFDLAYAYGVNYTLADNDGVDTLIVTGNGLTGTGHASTATSLYSVGSSSSDANTLIGGSGNDLLVGGIGADHLQGGLGNDIYAVFNSATQISDSGGFDLAYAYGVNYSLADNDGVDTLIMVGNGLTGAGHTSTATSLYSVETSASDVNTLIGGSGNDTLFGGIGADQLQGGAGNDIYLITNAATVVADSGGAADVAYASVSYQVADNSGLEILAVTGNGLTGRGSSGNDALYSIGSGNTLNGGSAGSDRFYFDAFTTSANTVTGFEAHNAAGVGDTVVLQNFADTSFASAVANNHIFQSGADVIVADATHTIATLQATQLANLHANDFMFA